MTKLRNNFIAGLLLLAPIAITVKILALLLSFLDGVSQPLLRLYIDREVPGVGIVLTVIVVLVVGYLSSRLVGQSIVKWFEGAVERIPLVSSVYRTVRQVIRGFSSGDRMSFKRTVLVRRGREGEFAIGFLTGEFSVASEQGVSAVASVYIPTNHLYLGDIAILPAHDVVYVDMTLEEGISAVLSCGGSITGQVATSLAATAERT
jgi:uncharacterized membrane protein